MNNETAAEPLHDNLRDLIGQAISDEIAAGAAQPDWCDSREIDRLADAVMAVLPKRRTTLSPALRAAMDEAAKTGATVAEIPGGGLVLINRGEQLEDGPDLNCPACGGSGHAEDARPMPALADDAFAAFCDREGYPSDGVIDVALREAFDEGLRFAAGAEPTTPTLTTPLPSGETVREWLQMDADRTVTRFMHAFSPEQMIEYFERKGANSGLLEIIMHFEKEYASGGAIAEWVKEARAIGVPVDAKPVDSLLTALKDIAEACNCCGDRHDLAQIAQDALEAYGGDIELSHDSQFKMMNHRLAKTYAAQPSAAQGDAAPMPHTGHTSPPAPPTAMQERAWFKEWLAGSEGNVSVDAVEFGRLAWAERARRAVKGAA